MHTCYTAHMEHCVMAWLYTVHMTTGDQPWHGFYIVWDYTDDILIHKIIKFLNLSYMLSLALDENFLLFSLLKLKNTSI